MACVALGLVHLGITGFGSVAGFLVIDEIVHFWSARDFIATGRLDLDTGYPELGSRELFHLAHMREHDGKVFSQYPPLFPILASPFVWLFGFRGFYVLNALSFLLILVLTYRLAAKLFSSPSTPLLACGVLAGCTFMWDYSQSAWSHLTAVLFLMASVYAALESSESVDRRRALVWAAASGLAGSVACGIRLDSIAVFFAVAVLLAFQTPVRYLEGLAVVLGALPGLLFLAWVNFQRFGTPNPFSYGTFTAGRTLSVPVAIAGSMVVLTLASWLVFHFRLRPTRVFLPLVALGCLAGIAVGWSHDWTQLAWGLLAYVGDSRQFHTARAMPAMSRLADGAVVYMGSIKKSLLQSLPFMPIAFLPFFSSSVTPDMVRKRILALVPVPLCSLVLFSALDYHGGLCLNMRYFLPLLPFLAIAGAAGLESTWSALRAPAVRVTGLLIVAFAVLFFLHGVSQEVGSPLHRGTVLTAPLLLAGLLACGVVGLGCAGAGRAELFRTVTLLGLVAALSWSLLNAFFYDFPRHQKQRSNNLAVGRVLLDQVPAKSILFTSPYIDPAMWVLTGKEIRVALPSQDDFADVPRLVEHHLVGGWGVYGLLRLADWQQLERRALRSYRVTPVYSFVERFDHGPTLHPLGPWPVGSVQSPWEGFVLSRVERRVLQRP